MGSEGGIRPRWLWGGVLEPSTDFYGLLNSHAAKVLNAVEALKDWIIADDRDQRFQRVRDFELEADVLKLQLGQKLVESFITPFDREDIYELGMRMDEVANAVKSTAYGHPHRRHHVPGDIDPRLARRPQTCIRASIARAQSGKQVHEGLSLRDERAFRAGRHQENFAPEGSV
jgi:uncharacterized protein Yka (UPF0111/DUF47 family)